MVDEFRSIRENLLKVLIGRGNGFAGDAGPDDQGESAESNAARALIGALLSRAGKSKDEVVQIIAREIGQAIAGMIREPLSALAKNQKLQISMEFVPKTEPSPAPGKSRPRKRRRAKIRAKRSSAVDKAGIGS